MARRKELPKYCTELLDRVERTTGRPLSLMSIDSERAFESHVHLGVAEEDSHRIIYWGGAERHRAHFLVTGAYKILRVWEAPFEDRMEPIMERAEDQFLPMADHLSSSFDDPAKAAVTAIHVVVGVGRQVTNYPVDLRVERDVCDEVGRHRVAQRKYVEEQCLGIVRALREPILQKLPHPVQETVTALHLGYMRCAAHLVGVEDLSFLFSDWMNSAAVDYLVGQFHATPAEPRHVGDRLLIDAWAKGLGLRDWYFWRRIRP